MECWLVLNDYTSYEVSDQGRVRNGKTKRVLTPQRNKQGSTMVALRKDGRTHFKSVRRLIAETFLDSPNVDDIQKYVPILLDGDPNNTRVDNLMWKPNWFAKKWAQQLTSTTPKLRRRIFDIDTNENWPNSLECAIALITLESRVMHSTGQYQSCEGRRLRAEGYFY